ncbi:[protein-PII] uridylyltransferase [bacterium]|nr:[protein-PII] uridylyltransferase [bacterium]
MPSLLEKAEASANKLLRLKTKPSASVELPKYRNFLKVESHRLKIEHRAGGEGLVIANARAKILDLVVETLYREILLNDPKPEKDPSKLAIVAYGGYGRGELNPCSDLDVMILHNQTDLKRSSRHQWLIDFCQTFFLSLTDIRLKILPVTRSIQDCVHIANDDVQSKTALIETRIIAGDQALFNKMAQTLLTQCVHRHERAYITERLADQSARRKKYGDSPYLQEPNIKNGCGGLRDYQNLLWMAFFKKRCRSIEDLLEHNIIDKSEYRQLTTAYDYLLRVRNEMHYLTTRPEEVLRRSIQPRVAFYLGFKENSPSKRIETFMHEVYTHLRTIYLLSRTLEQRMALFPENESFKKFSNLFSRQKPTQLDGFVINKGKILLDNPRAFKEQPRRLMRVFLYAQQRGLQLHPDLAYAIRSQLSLADRSFIQDKNVQETFIEILNQRGNVARTLRSMHEVGILGKFIPEFGRLTGKVQHEFYHVYTADEHTIVCVEELDRIWESKEPPYGHYSRVFERLERPYLLYLALILHDTGKANEKRKDHSVDGAKISQRVGKRLDLEKEDIKTLCFLVEEHLTMATVSQRRDLDDQSVIESHAQLSQIPEHVDLLALLTFADSMGTSKDMWNGFKDGLLRSLHYQTYEALSTETTHRVAQSKLRSYLRKKVEPKLPASIHKDEIDAHFEHLPDRYFRTNKADKIQNDLERVHQFMSRQTRLSEHSLDPIVSWHQERNRGHSTLEVATWDYSRVFAKLSGALAATGINILSANVFSRADGIILDTFSVVDAVTGSLVGKDRREAFHKTVTEIMMNEVNLDQLVGKAPKAAPLYLSLEDEKIEVKIEFENETAENRTIIDIDTEDRLGLLYVIATALAELKLDLSVAKISTERGAAIDSFYVMEADGGKILGKERQRFVRKKLLKAIARISDLTKKS